jgi:hypothetical protein
VDSESSGEISESTGDEGEQFTLAELAICARHVENLLKHITDLQRGLQTGQLVEHHRKRRMHKTYRRICRKIEANFLVTSSKPPQTPSRASITRIDSRNAAKPITIDCEMCPAGRFHNLADLHAHTRTFHPDWRPLRPPRTGDKVTIELRASRKIAIDTLNGNRRASISQNFSVLPNTEERQDQRTGLVGAFGNPSVSNLSATRRLRGPGRLDYEQDGHLRCSNYQPIADMERQEDSTTSNEHTNDFTGPQASPHPGQDPWYAEGAEASRHAKAYPSACDDWQQMHSERPVEARPSRSDSPFHSRLRALHDFEPSGQYHKPKAVQHYAEADRRDQCPNKTLDWRSRSREKHQRLPSEGLSSSRTGGRQHFRKKSDVKVRHSSPVRTDFNVGKQTLVAAERGFRSDNRRREENLRIATTGSHHHAWVHHDQYDTSHLARHRDLSGEPHDLTGFRAVSDSATARALSRVTEQNLPASPSKLGGNKSPAGQRSNYTDFSDSSVRVTWRDEGYQSANVGGLTHPETGRRIANGFEYSGDLTLAQSIAFTEDDLKSEVRCSKQPACHLTDTDDEEPRMYHGSFPVADYSLPEIGYGLDNLSDVSTNLSIIQGPLGEGGLDLEDDEEYHHRPWGAVSVGVEAAIVASATGGANRAIKKSWPSLDDTAKCLYPDDRYSLQQWPKSKAHHIEHLQASGGHWSNYEIPKGGTRGIRPSQSEESYHDALSIHSISSSPNSRASRTREQPQGTTLREHRRHPAHEARPAIRPASGATSTHHHAETRVPRRVEGSPLDSMVDAAEYNDTSLGGDSTRDIVDLLLEQWIKPALT